MKQTWKHTWKFSFSFFVLCTFGFSESSGSYGATSEAFIFSLDSKKGLAPFVSKVKPGNPEKAVYRSSQYGPHFGDDVVIENNADSNRDSKARLGRYYSVPPAVLDKRLVLAGNGRFTPDEVEVFYLDPSP